MLTKHLAVLSVVPDGFVAAIARDLWRHIFRNNHLMMPDRIVGFTGVQISFRKMSLLIQGFFLMYYKWHTLGTQLAWPSDHLRFPF